MEDDTTGDADPRSSYCPFLALFHPSRGVPLTSILLWRLERMGLHGLLLFSWIGSQSVLARRVGARRRAGAAARQASRIARQRSTKGLQGYKTMGRRSQVAWQRLAVVTVLLFAGAAKASLGDRLPDFKECVQVCCQRVCRPGLHSRDV